MYRLSSQSDKWLRSHNPVRWVDWAVCFLEHRMQRWDHPRSNERIVGKGGSIPFSIKFVQGLVVFWLQDQWSTTLKKAVLFSILLEIMIVSVGLLPEGTMPNGNPFYSRRWCIWWFAAFSPAPTAIPFSPEYSAPPAVGPTNEENRGLRDFRNGMELPCSVLPDRGHLN